MNLYFSTAIINTYEESCFTFSSFLNTIETNNILLTFIE